MQVDCNFLFYKYELELIEGTIQSTLLVIVYTFNNIN